jgi:hypothetical protein
VIRLGPGLVLGFHGCSGETAERLLSGDDFEQSNEDYDWLGPGTYFWEGDWQRAHEWATQRSGRRAYKDPSVVGAVIDLGNCLDLTTRRHLDLIAHYYELFRAEQESVGAELPVNKDLAGDDAADKLLRYLDRAVISFLHEQIGEEIEGARSRGETPQFDRFDTVRGLFPEGEPAYPGAGFLRKTHTQIAVRNPACIKGVFRPRHTE